jgi:hypothetical protein
MMSDGASIDYGGMMHDAMRGLIRRVLDVVAREGLPGEHHFFITFDTLHPDVAIADWLRERYPEEMTIVLQHWFEDLVVEERHFSVTLNFGDQPEPLRIPYDALKTFVDPSVEFGLRFETRSAEELEAADEEDDDEAPFEEVEEERSGPGEVVSLDKFRKR